MRPILEVANTTAFRSIDAIQRLKTDCSRTSNLLGSITHAQWFADSGERFNWYEVLQTQDRRSYVVEALEGVTGLPTPKSTPRSTRTSIGPRLLARFASAAAFSARTWHISNAVHDSSGMSNGLNSWVNEIPGVSVDVREEAYRYWFVLDHRQRAFTVIDVDLGLGWRRDRPAMTYRLTELYSSYGSRIDRVMADVLPAVE